MRSTTADEICPVLWGVTVSTAGDKACVLRRAVRKGETMTIIPDEGPLCPICGQAAEKFYYDKYGDAFGCDECVQEKEYWEVEDDA